jgi:hypothetical protein
MLAINSFKKHTQHIWGLMMNRYIGYLHKELGSIGTDMGVQPTTMGLFQRVATNNSGDTHWTGVL